MLYDNVKSICEEKGIPISKLEDDLTISKKLHLQMWNKNEPGIRKVQKVAEYLNVSIEELLERAD